MSACDLKLNSFCANFIWHTGPPEAPVGIYTSVCIGKLYIQSFCILCPVYTGRLVCSVFLLNGRPDEAKRLEKYNYIWDRMLKSLAANTCNVFIGILGLNIVYWV